MSVIEAVEDGPLDEGRIIGCYFNPKDLKDMAEAMKKLDENTTEFLKRAVSKRIKKANEGE